MMAKNNNEGFNRSNSDLNLQLNSDLNSKSTSELNFEINFASRVDKNEIDELRIQEYAQAKGYTVDLETLRWQPSDDDSFILVARQNGHIVSTMRGEVINDLSLLEKKLECPWDPDEPIAFPVLLLSRAATFKAHQSRGLNLVLRYWFLKLASFYDIPMVIGTFVEGSPRQNTLLQMGYRYFENKLGWQQSTYRSHRPVIVAALSMKDSQSRALSYCEDQFKSRNENYNFNAFFPPLRFVRSL